NSSARDRAHPQQKWNQSGTRTTHGLMTTETQQRTHGAILKGLKPGDFATLDERPKNGGSLQARKLSTGDVRFYFRYSQLNEATRGSEKLRKAIGVWDPAAPPKMR